MTGFAHCGMLLSAFSIVLFIRLKILVFWNWQLQVLKMRHPVPMCGLPPVQSHTCSVARSWKARCMPGTTFGMVSTVPYGRSSGSPASRANRGSTTNSASLLCVFPTHEQQNTHRYQGSTSANGITPTRQTQTKTHKPQCRVTTLPTWEKISHSIKIVDPCPNRSAFGFWCAVNAPRRSCLNRDALMRVQPQCPLPSQRSLVRGNARCSNRPSHT